jgi:hypothetical protein
MPDGQELFLFRGGPFDVVQRAAWFIGPAARCWPAARRSSSSPPGFRSSCWRRDARRDRDPGLVVPEAVRAESPETEDDAGEADREREAPDSRRAPGCHPGTAL